MQTRHGGRSQVSAASVHTPRRPGASLHVWPTFVHAAGCASSPVRRHAASAVTKPTLHAPNVIRRAMRASVHPHGGIDVSIHRSWRHDLSGDSSTPATLATHELQ